MFILIIRIRCHNDSIDNNNNNKNNLNDRTYFTTQHINLPRCVYSTSGTKNWLMRKLLWGFSHMALEKIFVSIPGNRRLCHANTLTENAQYQIGGWFTTCFGPIYSNHCFSCIKIIIIIIITYAWLLLALDIVFFTDGCMRFWFQNVRWIFICEIIGNCNLFTIVLSSPDLLNVIKFTDLIQLFLFYPVIWHFHACLAFFIHPRSFYQN